MTSKAQRRDTETLFDTLIPQWTRTHELLERVADEISSQRGVWRAGALPMPIPANSKSLSVSFSTGRLAGFALRETAGATAVVRLRDGKDTGADLLIPIGLNPLESTRDWFMPAGIGFAAGLYVDITGTVEGVIFLGPMSDG